VNNPNILGEYLRARREALRPEDVGIRVNSNRRVPGLRRDEVALLAGISNEYYTRLEQGRDTRPSTQVLDGIARALELDVTATAHLRRLAEPAQVRAGRPTARLERIRPSLVRLVDSLATPAWVEGRYLDVLHSNALAQALSPRFAPGVNLLRYSLDDDGPDIGAVGPEVVIASLAARLREMTGTALDDPRLHELVGELTVKSDLFRSIWSRHDVAPPPSTGRYPVSHPSLGEFELEFEKLGVLGSPGQTIVLSHTTAGSRAAEALALLALEISSQPMRDTSAPKRSKF
jgi:transcriptional regulator with XRE-family HTH domain